MCKIFKLKDIFMRIMNVGYNPTNKVNQSRPEFKGEFIGIVERTADGGSLHKFMKMLGETLIGPECNFMRVEDLDATTVRLTIPDSPDLNAFGEKLEEVVNFEFNENGIPAKIFFGS